MWGVGFTAACARHRDIVGVLDWRGCGVGLDNRVLRLFLALALRGVHPAAAAAAAAAATGGVVVNLLVCGGGVCGCVGGGQF